MATERFNETTEAPGGIPRDVASAWAIELWEKLQDVYSNEAAWALLDGSRSTSMDEVALATGTIENARKAIEKAIEQRDAALSADRGDGHGDRRGRGVSSEARSRTWCP
jgi:hypothetical protein